MSKVVAGGLASATAALFGSYFGVLGTVGAAAATSVVTAVSSEVYQRSLDRTAGRLRGPNGNTSGQHDPRYQNDPRYQDDPRHQHDPRYQGMPATQPPRRRSILPGVVIGSLVTFAVGVGLVSVGEYARGAPLSGGSGGTSVGELLDGTLHPTVGNLLGTGSQTGDSGQGDKHTDDQGKRQQPGLVGGLLSGL